jgi:hypothetical protein
MEPTQMTQAVYTNADSMPMPPYDPREQRVLDRLTQALAPPCRAEAAHKAWSEMHDTRAAIIGDVAQTDIRMALGMLLGVYPGADTHRALLLFAALSDEHGPATVRRVLLEQMAERAR